MKRSISSLKRTLVLALSFAAGFGVTQAQFTCATATPIADGACLNGQALGGSFSGGFAGCNGGSTPVRFYSFTAPLNGDCVQFNITGTTADATWEIMIFNGACASYVAGSGGCVSGSLAGAPFSVSSESSNGTNLLTPGNSYTLILSADVPETYNICFTSPGTLQASDICSGATGMPATPTVYNNIGDCSYSGAIDNASHGEPTNIALPSAATFSQTLCAGSIENSRWFTFTAATSGNITITGSSITCVGGGCGYQFGIFSAGVGGNCASSLTNLGCVSNGPGCGAGPDPNSQLTRNPPNRITWSGVGATGFTATISGVSAGEVFYFVMDGNADSDCQFTLVGTGIVPVEFGYFTARNEKEGVLLDWSIFNRDLGEKFEVLRSDDGISFDPIATLNMDDAQKEYSFLDRQAPQGEVYYQVHAIDGNGARSYTEIIRMNNTATAASSYVSGNTLYVTLGEELRDQQIGLVLSDASGRVLKDVSFPGTSGNFEASLDLLSPGMYIVTLNYSGKRQSMKFVVN